MIAGAARRRLANLARRESNRIDETIRSLALEPRPHGVEKLTDKGNLFRVRVGEYRVVYRIDDLDRLIAVEDVRERDDVYRKGGN